MAELAVPANHSRTPESPVWLTLLLALTYAVSGLAGLLLGAPSPVFPSAGLALSSMLWFGSRAIPGIWLGAFGLNLFLNWMGEHWLGSSLSLGLLLETAVISMGATVQALVGARLVKNRLQADWWEIAHERDVVRFLFYGGVLAGFLSASFGTAALLASGQIVPRAISFTWWTWYVGDVIGILVFAPLTLLVLNRHNALWRDRRRLILTPMLVTLCLAVLVFHGARRWEQHKDVDQVRQIGASIARDIGNRLNAHRDVLLSLKYFIEATPNFSRRQFEQFAGPTLAENPDVSSLSFNPLVSGEDRAAYEARFTQIQPKRPFFITELDHHQRMIRAATRPLYVPVELIVPREGNHRAVGFDTYSEPFRRAAIVEALRSGDMAVTAPIKLVQDSQSRASVLEYLPVNLSPPIGHGSAVTRGFVVAVVRIDDMIALATQAKAPAGLVLNLSHPDGLGNGSAWHYRIYATDTRSGHFSPAISGQTQVPIGRQDWILSVAATDDYLERNRSWVAWIAGVFGLLFAALLQIYMLAMTGGSAIIKRKNLELEAAEVVLRDLNANLERKVTERTAELAAASAAKSQFLAHMSHEIRTPMNAVLGMTQLLKSEPLSEEQQESVEHILAAGQLLLSIINDILDFSRIEVGRLKLDAQPFDLVRVLDHITSLMRASARDKGLVLSVESSFDPASTLLGDALRLEQVLVNLIGNAIKFTEHGRVTIRVRSFGTTPASTSLRFEIEDTGIGIPPESLADIFTPFTQADSTINRRFGGTGLGLAISRQLVEIMGGELNVKSTPGEGSTFWFELTFQLTNQPFAPSHRAQLPARQSPCLQHKRILIVDDSELNRKVVERRLLREGAQTTSVGDGAQALQCLQRTSEPFELVLMDMQMPVMDGLEATRMIRGELGLAHLPVIALSAGVLPEQREQARDAGCNDFVTKPIDLEELITVILRWTSPPKQTPAYAREEPAGILPTISGLDTQRAVSLLDGDRGLFLELLDDFIKEFESAADATRTDIASEDRGAAARRLHALRGAAGYLGALELIRSAQSLETAILEHRTELTAMIADFDEKLTGIVEASAPFRMPRP